MRKWILLVLSTFVLGQAFSQYVVLYQDCYYRGKSKVLYPGRHNLSALGFSGQVSSAKVPPGLKLVLYEDPSGSSGAKTRFTSDVPCLAGDWNDRAQFVLIERDNTGGNTQYQPEQSRPVYPSYGNNGAQVILYEDCSLRGRSVTLVPGNYHTRELGINNDALSSIRIPKGYSVAIYKDDGFRGQSQTFYGTVYCLDGNWNDQTSSIIVYGPGGSHNANSSSSNNYYYNDNNSYSGSRDMVTFYADCNYGGYSFSMPVGKFKEQSIKVGNDKISSFRIPYGFRLTVYQNDGFGGRSQTFTGSVKCLDGSWNDQISSFIIEGPGSPSGNVDFFNNNNNDYHNYSPSVSYGENFEGVMVYADSWYKGNHQVYNPGSYDLRYSSLKSNISSIAIQPGYRVVVYEDFGYRGRSQTFTASVPNLAGFGWNDNIRSIRVYRY